MKGAVNELSDTVLMRNGVIFGWALPSLLRIGLIRHPSVCMPMPLRRRPMRMANVISEIAKSNMYVGITGSK